MAEDRIILPITVEDLEDDRILVYTDAIQGCLAEGADLEDAILNFEDVARMILEVLEEDGADIPTGMGDFRDRGFEARVETRYPA
jgi:predicted RNase H-like HicB family nuclease